MRAPTERIQLVRGPPLPQVPIPSQGQVAGKASGRTFGVRIFPCGVYAASAPGSAGAPEQTPDVRSVVSGYRRDLAVDCGRSGTPRSADRLLLYPALVGANPQFEPSLMMPGISISFVFSEKSSLVFRTSPS